METNLHAVGTPSNLDSLNAVVATSAAVAARRLVTPQQRRGVISVHLVGLFVAQLFARYTARRANAE